MVEGVSDTGPFDSADLSTNFQCILGKTVCDFTMEKKSASVYHIDIDFDSKTLENEVITFLYDGGVALVSFEESFVTIFVPRYDPDLNQFGSDWDFTLLGQIMGVVNLVIIGLVSLLTVLIKLKTGNFFIKSFFFRFLDSSNNWYFLVFATITKPASIITLIEGFNTTYWKVLRLVPLLNWIEFDE